MIELFVAEIAGRPVLALNAKSVEAAQAILAEPGVRADLKAFRSGEAALWNGRDKVYLREPFPEERALWEASFLEAIGRSGAAHDDAAEETWICLLVAVSEPANGR